MVLLSSAWTNNNGEKCQINKYSACLSLNVCNKNSLHLNSNLYVWNCFWPNNSNSKPIMKLRNLHGGARWRCFLAVGFIEVCLHFSPADDAEALWAQAESWRTTWCRFFHWNPSFISLLNNNCIVLLQPMTVSELKAYATNKKLLVSLHKCTNYSQVRVRG